MPVTVNPLFFKYVLTCTFPGCIGRQEVDQAMSAGWELGKIVEYDASVPEVAHCPKCKRYQMKVTRAPEPTAPQQPVGWNKIPTE